MIYALPSNDEEALRHLQSCMQRFSFGSYEYELARKSFAWLCARLRTKEKLERETLPIR